MVMRKFSFPQISSVKVRVGNEIYFYMNSLQRVETSIETLKGGNHSLVFKKIEFEHQKIDTNCFFSLGGL